MDYLSVICAPVVARVGAETTNAYFVRRHYYHGVCVTPARFKNWTKIHPVPHPATNYHYEFHRVEAEDLNGLPEAKMVSFGKRGHLAVCDTCHKPLEDLPC